MTRPFGNGHIVLWAELRRWKAHYLARSYANLDAGKVQPETNTKYNY
jgi:hypothetical protein